jgi:hypothetical protein
MIMRTSCDELVEALKGHQQQLEALDQRGAS